MKTPRILLVDDSEVVLATLPLVLAGHFEVETCPNPMLIAAKLRQTPFDILLLDVDMPALSGPQAVLALRRFDALGSTKVALYSARQGEALEELSLSCGAAGAIPKDTTGPDLIAALNRLLEDLPTGSTGGHVLLQGVEAIVFAQAPLEARLVRLLGELGVHGQARGVLGIDRVMREVGAGLVIFEEAAIDDLPGTLARLHTRGVVGHKALLVIGASATEEAIGAPGLDLESLGEGARAALSRVGGQR
ncbi:MAG: response regulator transcription factor [Planctomycetes bacterium]|nr:response regulator transcription factor [Planctomycetota bacterium]